MGAKFAMSVNRRAFAGIDKWTSKRYDSCKYLIIQGLNVTEGKRMRNKKLGLFFLFGFFLLLLNACAYTQNSMGTDSIPNEKPAQSDKFCVMLPPDIAQGSKVYFRSGQADPESTVAHRLFTTLSSNRPSTIFIETSNEDKAVEQCSLKGAKYLFSPLIKRWQGRASEFSFMRNVVEIEIRLIRVQPRALVRSVVFEARNGWFNADRDDPAELLTNDCFKQPIIDLID